MKLDFLSLLRILLALCCLVFGLDKFLEFLPFCSLNEDISIEGMIGLGIVETGLGMALLFNRKLLLFARLSTAIMMGGLIMHLLQGTKDFGGALIGTILGLLLIFTYKRLNK